MKLVHVFTVPWALTFITGQAAYMKRRGMSVDVIASPGGGLADFASQEGVSAHAVEMPRSITPLCDVLAVYRLWLILRKVRAGIIHAHTPKGGLLGMTAGLLAHVPVRIYHVHGLPFMTAKGFKRRLLRWTERISCRLAHQVYCVSHSIRNVAISDGICAPEKIRVLLRGSINGVDAVDRFNPERIGPSECRKVRELCGIPPEAPVLGFVGRVVKDKGIAELSESWKKLREAFPNLHLLIVGPLEPQDPLPPDVNYLLQNDPRVHLVGYARETVSYYSLMDIVVLPSYREGFPLAVTEAAAMGLPVVATRVPGCMDSVIDGITGTLIPARDAAALTEAVGRYLLDSGLRAKHGSAARDRILRDFRPEDMWAALYAEYMRLLKHRRPALSFLSLIQGMRQNSVS